MYVCAIRGERWCMREAIGHGRGLSLLDPAFGFLSAW